MSVSAVGMAVRVVLGVSVVLLVGATEESRLVTPDGASVSPQGSRILLARTSRRDSVQDLSAFDVGESVGTAGGAPKPCSEELTGRGADYRGCQTQTNSGKKCQRWDTQSPHKHGNTPEKRPDKDLAGHNYCRNASPGSSSTTIWCYTTDPGKRWEYCTPKAPAAASSNSPAPTDVLPVAILNKPMLFSVSGEQNGFCYQGDAEMSIKCDGNEAEADPFIVEEGEGNSASLRLAKTGQDCGVEPGGAQGEQVVCRAAVPIYEKVGDNYCVSATGVDLQQTNHPDGDASRGACKSDCDKNAQCSAIEWYNGGWGGSKCKLLLDTRNATQAKQGSRWQDAECWVRKEAVQSQAENLASALIGKTVGLWNPTFKRFVRMPSDGNLLDRSDEHNGGSLPSNWAWGRFKVVDGGDGTIGLWNPTFKRFVRMPSGTNLDRSDERNDGSLPSNWAWERFKVVAEAPGSCRQTLAGSTNQLLMYPQECSPIEETHHVRCCGQNGEKIPMLNYGNCQTGNYSEAHDICQSHNYRLCTVDEVMDCKSCGTGCGYDWKRIWTKSPQSPSAEEEGFQTKFIISSEPDTDSGANSSVTNSSNKFKLGLVIQSNSSTSWCTLAASNTMTCDAPDREDASLFSFMMNGTKKECRYTLPSDPEYLHRIPAQCSPLDEEHQVECCNQTGKKIAASSYGCPENKTFAQAVSICEEKGFRLCTFSEITDNEFSLGHNATDNATDTMCQYNASSIWSNSSKAPATLEPTGAPTTPAPTTPGPTRVDPRQRLQYLTLEREFILKKEKAVQRQLYTAANRCMRYENQREFHNLKLAVHALRNRKLPEPVQMAGSGEFKKYAEMQAEVLRALENAIRLAQSSGVASGFDPKEYSESRNDTVKGKASPDVKRGIQQAIQHLRTKPLETAENHVRDLDAEAKEEAEAKMVSVIDRVEGTGGGVHQQGSARELLSQEIVASLSVCNDSTLADGSPWVDSVGNTCSWYYSLFRCTDNTRKDGCTSSQACCTCGGGNSICVPPTSAPTSAPTYVPSGAPSESPTVSPTPPPTSDPTYSPTTPEPTTSAPTAGPTFAPSEAPSFAPSVAPSFAPTSVPTPAPTGIHLATQGASACDYGVDVAQAECVQAALKAIPNIRKPRRTQSIELKVTSQAGAPSGCSVYIPPSADAHTEYRAESDLGEGWTGFRPPRKAILEGYDVYFNPESFSPNNGNYSLVCTGHKPTVQPTSSPSFAPSYSPSYSPTDSPSFAPTDSPTLGPTDGPTDSPTLSPSMAPSFAPTSIEMYPEYREKQLAKLARDKARAARRKESQEKLHDKQRSFELSVKKRLHEQGVALNATLERKKGAILDSMAQVIRLNNMCKSPHAALNTTILRAELKSLRLPPAAEAAALNKAKILQGIQHFVSKLGNLYELNRAHATYALNEIGTDLLTFTEKLRARHTQPSGLKNR